MIKRRSFLATVLGLFGAGLVSKSAIANQSSDCEIHEWPEYKAFRDRLDGMAKVHSRIVVGVYAQYGKKTYTCYSFERTKVEYQLETMKCALSRYRRDEKRFHTDAAKIDS